VRESQSSTLQTAKDVSLSAQSAQPIVLEGRLPTPAEAALIDYAKQVVIKSVETALDFHKTMLGISATFGASITTLVPILIWGDKDAKIPSGTAQWLLLVPSILMLLSSVCFAFGYYPRHTDLNPNDLASIREAREHVINQRKCLAAFGLGLFWFALMLTVGLVLFLKGHVPA
jgi:hypothetical protein